MNNVSTWFALSEHLSKHTAHYVVVQEHHATAAPTVGRQWNQPEKLCAAKTCAEVVREYAASVTASRRSPPVSRRQAESSPSPSARKASSFHIVVDSLSWFDVVR